MPVVLSWLLGSPVVPSFASPGSLLPPSFGASEECPVVGYTQAELLDIVARSYPQEYLQALQAQANGGYEVFEASAQVLARVSAAVAELYCCALLAFAHGGALASGTVELVRETAVGGAITVGAGTILEASRTGRRFRTLTAVTFGALALGPFVVAVQAIEFGSEYNLPGVTITGGGETVPGEIDTVRFLANTSVGFDVNLQCRQLAATSGGASPCLDGLGEDLSIPREALESDARYRQRIITTPDTVSPAAIERGLDSIVGALGLHVCLREVGTSRLPGFFFDAGSSADSPQVPANNYAFDMDFSVRPADRYKLILDYTDFRAFMLVGVPKVVDIDFGFVFDGTRADAFPLQNAFDTTSPTASSAAFDGFTSLNASLYKSIYNIVNEKRAGGVGFELYQETIGCE